MRVKALPKLSVPPVISTAPAQAHNHGVTHYPALMTQEDELHERGARKPWIYEQLKLGFDYRTDEMSAALGLSQVGKLQHLVDRCTPLADLYGEVPLRLHLSYESSHGDRGVWGYTSTRC